MEVRASLDDPQRALELARNQAEAGDESWEQWVTEFERGDALVVRLEVCLFPDEIEPDVITTTNRGVFVEKEVHPAKFEQQIAELVSKDYPLVAEELRARGHQLDMLDLAEMYVHVELDPRLLDSLQDEPARHLG